VRILGLFIASIGASMFLTGIQVWFRQLPGR
jgi:small neutral amino acid transporter SnatA (MarC family)